MALEKKIEHDVCKYARTKGFLTPKLNVVGERGWPDRMFIDPDGWVIFIEFKKKGKPCEPIQIYRQGILAARNFVVLVCDDIEEGKELVDELVAARVSEESNEDAPKSGERGVILRPRFGED